MDFKTIGLILLGIVLFAKQSVNSLVNGLEFKTARITSSSLQGINWNLSINLTLSNSSSIPVILDNFTGFLAAGTNNLGAVQLTQPITVPGMSDIEIPIDLSVPLLGVLGGILSQIAIGTLPQDLRIEGTGQSAGISYPVSINLIG